jgi:hypothetical protein
MGVGVQKRKDSVYKYEYLLDPSKYKGSLQSFAPYVATNVMRDPLEFSLPSVKSREKGGPLSKNGGTIIKIPVYMSGKFGHYITKRDFIVNSSIRSMTVSFGATLDIPDFDMKLTRPDGTIAPYTVSMSFPSPGRGWSSSKYVDVEVRDRDAGKWTMELVNNTENEDCIVTAKLIGRAGGVDNTYFNSISCPYWDIDKSKSGEYVTVEVSLSRGNYVYTGIKQELEVNGPDGNISTLSLKDDGMGDDLVAGDSSYTGTIKLGSLGRYYLRAKASNGEGKPILLPKRREYEFFGKPPENQPEKIESDECIDTLSDRWINFVDSSVVEE